MRIGIDWLHDKLQIPMAEEGAAILVGPSAAAPAAVPPGGAPSLPEPDTATGEAAAKDKSALASTKRGLFTALLAQDAAQGDAQDDPARLEPALQAQAAAAWGNTVDQVHALVARADSLEALKDDLLRLYGGLDPQPLTDVMAAAFSVAKLRGIDSVRGETK